MTDASGAERRTLWAAWGLLIIWAVATTLYPGTPLEEATSPIPMLYILFVILHAGVGLGAKGLGVMLPACYLIAFAAEGTSIHTGFPFGWYEHSDVLGVKLWDVPLFIPIGFFAITWPAWLIARLILGRETERPCLVWTPLVMAFVATGFDAASDAIGATVHHYWRYATPSGILGVPLSNYMGWIFTCWVIGLAYALLEPRFKPLPPASDKAYWLPPIVFWLVMGLQFAFARHAPAAKAGGVALREGRSWLVADVYEGAATAAILIMLPPALMALARLYRSKTE
jgi:uncharacterized membrane protein